MDFEQKEIQKQMLLNQLTILMIMKSKIDEISEPSAYLLLDTSISVSKDILKVYFNMPFTEDHQ